MKSMRCFILNFTPSSLPGKQTFTYSFSPEAHLQLLGMKPLVFTFPSKNNPKPDTKTVVTMDFKRKQLNHHRCPSTGVCYLLLSSFCPQLPILSHSPPMSYSRTPAFLDIL